MAGLVAFAKLFDKAQPAGTSWSSLLQGTRYISGSQSWNTTSLVSNDITRVISLGEPLENVDPRCLQHHLCIFDFDDYASTDLRRILPSVFAFEAMSERNLLIHCFAGVSRSAAVVIALLMKTRGEDLEAAASMLIRARPCVQPNDGFLCQLYDLANEWGQNSFATRTYPTPTAETIWRYIRLRGYDDREVLGPSEDEPIQVYVDDPDQQADLQKAFPGIRVCLRG